MPFTYRPMLKTKAGEATALSNLSTAEKNRTEPVFHVAERPPATFAPKMGAAWAGRRCYLDGAFNFNATGSSTDFDNTFNAIGAVGISVLPVIEIGADPAYNQAAIAHIGRFAPGIMLKTTLGHLPAAAAWVEPSQISQANIDLLIDAGHLAEIDPLTFAPYISHTIASALATSQWRSVTLASSSAPKDFGQLSRGATVVRRIDWLTWSAMAQPLNKPVDYGDFGISHRDLTEPPGAAMAGATVSVRYTINDNWVMIKGQRATGQHAVPMGTQYRSHAQTLVARPDFGGLTACWADQRIQTIAATTSGSAGGRAQWVEINANRHFAFILNRLP